MNPNLTEVNPTPPLRVRLILLAVVLLLMVGCIPGDDPAPTADLCASFCVGENFQDFYAQNGGADVLGDPISGVLELADQEQVQTQYFESIRLDYEVQTGVITIHDLGSWAFEGLTDASRAIIESNSSGGSGYTVDDHFVDYYEQHNGSTLFGQPLSPLMSDGIVKVQYFENVRLEWQPGLSTISSISSGSLGRAHFERTVFLFDVVPQPAAVTVEQVNLDAAVSAPILFGGESQTVWVAATSTNQQPADNIRIEITLAETETPLTLQGVTDGDGKVLFTLTAAELQDHQLHQPGKRLHAVVSAFGAGDQLIGETTISFETWW